MTQPIYHTPPAITTNNPNISEVGRGKWTTETLISAIATFFILYISSVVVSEIFVPFVPRSWEHSLIYGSKTPTIDTLLVPSLSGNILQLQGLSKTSGSITIMTDDDGMVNAFASIGGTVTVTQTLINQAKTQEEVLFVIAHEYGHHKHRHILRGLVRGILLLPFAIIIGDSSIINNITELGNLFFSRRYEIQSDDYATSYLISQKKNPLCAIDFFAQHPTWIDTIIGRVSTHPGDIYRRNRIIAQASDHGYMVPLSGTVQGCTPLSINVKSEIIPTETGEKIK